MDLGMSSLFGIVAAVTSNSLPMESRTTFSRLSQAAQDAIVDAMLTDGQLLVSAEVKAEVQRWAELNEDDHVVDPETGKTTFVYGGGR